MINPDWEMDPADQIVGKNKFAARGAKAIRDLIYEGKAKEGEVSFKELDAEMFKISEKNRRFKVGATIEIGGLKSEKGKKLNGQIGTLEEYNEFKDRWSVKLRSTGATKLLRPKNLFKPGKAQKRAKFIQQYDGSAGMNLILKGATTIPKPDVETIAPLGLRMNKVVKDFTVKKAAARRVANPLRPGEKPVPVDHEPEAPAELTEEQLMAQMGLPCGLGGSKPRPKRKRLNIAKMHGGF